jgi:hypothetical protein
MVPINVVLIFLTERHRSDREPRHVDCDVKVLEWPCNIADFGRIKCRQDETLYERTNRQTGITRTTKYLNIN